MNIKKLEKIIGPKPNQASYWITQCLFKESDYFVDLIDWLEEAVEHESARAERWKKSALMSFDFMQGIVETTEKDRTRYIEKHENGPD